MTDLLPDGSGPAQRRVPLPRALGAAAGVAALAALAAWARHATAPAEGLLLLDLVLAVLGGLAVPLLLRYPLAGTLGLTAAATLSVSLTPAASLGVLLVAQRRSLPVAAAAGVAAHAAQGVWRPHEDVSLGWWLALVAVGYSALVGWGVLLRTHRALAWALRERARRAEAEQGRRVAEARMLERTRLAREMHDVLAHRLSLLATYAGALE
ncbi:histidine kinase [Thermobifida cellulosilytica]|uniref:histidine kinase n=1 Tax=Thermobifida cellulosilytica TaxID=144786 RepID=UPI000A719181|nr:histidine kinase [Thermobifida cellulosilytica]